MYYVEKQYYKIDGESSLYNKLFIASYNFEEDTLYKIEITIDEKPFLDVDLLISSQGNLLYSGNYSIDKTFKWEENHYLKGIFYCILSPKNLKVLSKGQINLLKMLPDDSFEHYYLTNTFQLDEDHVAVLCEFKNTICDNGNCDAKYGDLLVANFELKEKK